MRFLSKAKLQFEYKDDDGVKWFSLKQDLILYLGKKEIELRQSTNVNKSELIIVPKEMFIFDVASIPRFLHWLYKPTGKYTRSAIIHDYLYSKREVKRSYADMIFRKCMKLDGVNWFTRWAFWASVRVAGRSHKA